jgi:oligo-1,6-glucosidase
MQWDGAEHAGFTGGRPWLAVNPNYREINAEAALADPDSVFHHYRRLIELRHSEPVVALGDFTMLVPDDERIYAFVRRLGGVRLLVMANFSGEQLDVDVLHLGDLEDLAGSPDRADSELLISNYSDAPSTSLRPWEARVYRQVAGVTDVTSATGVAWRAGTTDVTGATTPGD